MLFRTTDPLGRDIILMRMRFRSHILSRHPDMKNRLAKIRETVEQPEKIVVGTSERRLYHRKWPEGPNYLRVVVHLEQGRGSGHIITAFWCESIAGGVAEWERP